MRDYDNSNDPVELDAPIFIFPDDEEDSGSGSSSGLSFGKVSTDKDKQEEKEFVYMPFLDDAEKDASSSGSKTSFLSFSKVKAAKKESEFVFMPFLNDKGVEDTETDDRHFHVRPDGTVFDEGMVLIPLSPLTDEDEEDEDEDEVEQDTDTGIYVTDTAPGAYVPPKRPSQKKNTKGNSKNGKKKRPPNGGSRNGKGNPAVVEEQFRAVMKNINPDVRRAAMRDPVQRAALEQAVRIALVQQAAQEAVAKTTGSVSGYASYMLHNPSAPDIGIRKNSRPRQPQQQQPAPNVRGFQFSGFDSAPAEFNVGGAAPAPQPAPQPVPQPAPEPEIPVVVPEPAIEENIDFASTLSSQASPSPDIAQDPVLASLTPSSNPNRTAPSAQQDPALSSLTRSQNGATKTPVSFTSPAAIRAAMRAGIDIQSLQQNNNAPAAASAASTQKQKLQDAVDTKKSGCLIWIIIVFFIFFVGLVTVAVWPALSTERKYQNASALMADGEYIAASESFAALEDYKDSPSKSQESIYLYASDLETAGIYDTAINYFLTIPEYPGANERLAECRYNLGLRNLNNRNYALAYDYLHLIPKYNDAGDLALQANYLCGMEFFDAGDFESAAIRFGMYPDYNDSYSYWQTSMYNAGRNFVQKGVYASAFDCFSQLGGYSDSAYFAALARYHMIIGGEEVTFEETRAVIETLANYGAKVDYNHNALIPARLSGMWRNNDTGYYISYQVINDVPTFKTNMTGSTITLENVFFADNMLCYTVDGGDRALITVESFEPSNAVTPDLVNVYSYITESEITFIRIY